MTSVCLGQPRIKAEFVQDKAHMFVFQISVIQRHKTLLNKQNEHVIKYTIKANSEQDMVEWVAALREKIE